MVDGVKAPQPRDGVEEPMRRVLAEVGDDHHLDELHRQRLRLNGLVEPQALPAADARTVAGMTVSSVVTCTSRWLTKKCRVSVVQPGRNTSWSRTLRKQPLERHEDHREQQQVEQEPVEAQIDAAACTASDRHVGAAEQQRRQRQRRSRSSPASCAPAAGRRAARTESRRR